MHLRTTMIWMCGIVLFYAIVCTPVYLWVSSDVLLADSVFPLIWDTLMSVCNYLFYWIALSSILYALIRYGIGECKPFFLSIGILSVLRYFTNHIAGCFVTGFQSINDFFSYYLPYILFDVAFDLVLMTIVIVLMHVTFKEHLSIGAKEEERTSFLSARLPLENLFDWKNPIGKAALFAAWVPAAFKILSRLIYDFSYGAPTGLSDLLWMITFYVFDVLSVLIGYVVLIWLVHRSYMNDLKAKSEFESN